MNAAAVVHPTLVLVNARRHVLDPVALVAEARGHARHHAALVLAAVRTVAGLLVFVLARRILVICGDYWIGIGKFAKVGILI